MLVGDIVRRNAEYFAEHDAVIAPGGRQINWIGLELRTNQLARALRDLGVSVGDRLSILAPNAVEYIEYFFACAKSGIVGAPLNPRLALDEIAKYANYVEPTALLVHASLRDRAADLLPLVPSIRHVIGFGGEHGQSLDFETLIATADGAEFQEDLDETAYYMLCPTSGTTGLSKGAVMSQRNAIAAMQGWLADFFICQGDTYFQSIPNYLNAGGPAHLHPVFMKGGRTVIVPGFEAELFMQCVQKYKVTHTTSVPTMIKMVLNHPRVHEYDLSSLRAITLGAAPVSRELVVAARAVMGNCIVPSLGMAETYSCGTSLRPEVQFVDGTPEQVRRLGSIGKPHTHLMLRVVDFDGHEVARDNEAQGEIWIKGDSVSEGYYKMPEETAASHVDGWFKTGDVAVVDDEGYITIVDRLKDIIISGGYNVASNEVEAVIASYTGIDDCAVVGVPHPKWGEAVHAVVVTSQGDLDSGKLIEYVGQHLAAYKRPLSVSVVDELPRNPTGKVLKRTLRAQFAGQWKDLSFDLGTK